jgi:hypothetical protein
MDARVILFAAATITATACASTPQAPMHVYNSAFLENDGMVDAKPRSRTFDPLRTGDFNAGGEVFVVRNDGRWTGRGDAVAPDALAPDAVAEQPVNDVAASPATPRPSDSPATQKDQSPSVAKPSLSTTAPSAVGGKETRVAPKESPSKTVDSGGYTPASAAEFVAAVYSMNGVELPAESPAAVYKSCKAKGNVYFGTKPKVGDIVFFHNTFDANADGRNNDWYTHVGMVQLVGDDATAEVVAWHDGAVRVHTINLERPEVAEDSGNVINSRLREPGNDDAPFTQYYAGQLFAGFCGLLGEKDEFVLVENWQPGMDLGR